MHTGVRLETYHDPYSRTLMVYYIPELAMVGLSKKSYTELGLLLLPRTYWRVKKVWSAMALWLEWKLPNSTVSWAQCMIKTEPIPILSLAFTFPDSKWVPQSLADKEYNQFVQNIDSTIKPHLVE